MKIKRTPRLFGPMVPIVAVVLMLVVFGMDKAGKISGKAFRNWSFSIMLVYAAWEISWHRIEAKLKSEEKEL